MTKNKSDEDVLFNALFGWVRQTVGKDAELEQLPGGLSTKTFYRVNGLESKAILAMHAPPPENLARYCHNRDLLAGGGIRVPSTIATDFERDFALIEDIGDKLYLDLLEAAPGKRQELYVAACETINRIQLIPTQGCGLPAYDDALLDWELSLFPEWYAKRYRGKELDDDEKNDYAKVSAILKDNFANQPQVVTHRDFHSGNLFATDPGPCVIDFSAALVGPQTFDPACLLRDLYVELDDEVQLDLLVRQWEHARKLGLPVAPDFSDHYLRFELTSLQRMAKVIGQFVRLHMTSKMDDRYLDYLPHGERLVHSIALRYRDLRPLAIMLEARVAK